MFEYICSYVWSVLTGIAWWLFMYLGNRTIVVGRENFPRNKNTLIIANHLTMIDSWFIAMACIWPAAILRPSLIPWHLPERKNFMRRWPLTAMCRLWRCIPITRGSGDFLKKIDQIGQALRCGTVMIFPEGTRSRQPKSGILGKVHRGAALLALRNDATVTPVAIRGSEDVLPCGTWFPRLGKKIVIVIGQPMRFDSLAVETISQAEDIVSDIMTARLQRLLTDATKFYEKNQKSPA